MLVRTLVYLSLGGACVLGVALCAAESAASVRRSQPSANAGLRGIFTPLTPTTSNPLPVEFVLTKAVFTEANGPGFIAYAAVYEPDASSPGTPALYSYAWVIDDVTTGTITSPPAFLSGRQGFGEGVPLNADGIRVGDSLRVTITVTAVQIVGNARVDGATVGVVTTQFAVPPTVPVITLAAASRRRAHAEYKIRVQAPYDERGTIELEIDGRRVKETSGRAAPLVYAWAPTAVEEKLVTRLSAVDLTFNDARTTARVRFNKHGVPHLFVVPSSPLPRTGPTGATGPA